MRPHRSTLSSLLPLLVAVVSLSVTAWLWSHEREVGRRTLRADFDFSVRQTASRIEQRMASYEQMLRGAQGLFRAAGVVDRGHFAAYVDALMSGADFAGIQAICYHPLGDAGGVPTGHLTFVAPDTPSNLGALGQDAWSDPARRVAMSLARDSGGLAISARLPAGPADGADAAPGFSIWLPLYAPNRPADSVADRRAALTGWVSASIRMSDLMSSLYGEGTPGIDVRIHDGVGQTRESLMYPTGADAQASGPRPGAYSAQEYIAFAGHTWTLGVGARPEFEQSHGRDAAPVIALSGVVLSLLLALTTHQLVTGRARAHETARAMTRRLRASEERYRQIVETTDEGVWLTDAEGLTTFVNPKLARMLGCEPAAIIGRPMADFLEPADADEAAAEDPPAGSGPRERRFRRPDGSTLWVSVTVSPLASAGGTPGGTLAMVTDVSRRHAAEATRQQLEAQLRESQKMEAIGTLAGGIAHDFNNILAAIIGNVALARDAVSGGGPVLPPLDQIGQAATRARSLVQQILAFGRRQPPRRVVQPMRPQVEEALRLLRPILPALVELELQLADEPLPVAADATQLQQVVMNLCTNAWHALKGRPGRITVGLAPLPADPRRAARPGAPPPGRCAHLWVADTGCGMDAATRARVFEPFFTTKPVGQGTGLGLSVVHGIVATHDGTIAVESAPDRGSRFDLYFPLAVEAPPAEPPAERATPAPARAGEHVVCVDDDPLMLLMMQGLLQRSGYRVSCHEDPQEALAALRADPGGADLVVSDYNMPGLSGLDLARELRRLRPGLPVVISTGFLSEDVHAAAAKIGVSALLQKEYTLERLPGIVQRVLDEARAAAEAAAGAATAAPARA